jgi:hypothetical protein
MAQCDYRGQTYDYHLTKAGLGNTPRDFALHVAGRRLTGFCGLSLTVYRDKRPHGLDVWSEPKRGTPDWLSGEVDRQQYDIQRNDFDNGAILKLGGKVVEDWQSFTWVLEEGEPERLRVVEL